VKDMKVDGFLSFHLLLRLGLEAKEEEKEKKRNRIYHQAFDSQEKKEKKETVKRLLTLGRIPKRKNHSAKCWRRRWELSFVSLGFNLQFTAPNILSPPFPFSFKGLGLEAVSCGSTLGRRERKLHQISFASSGSSAGAHSWRALLKMDAEEIMFSLSISLSWPLKAKGKREKGKGEHLTYHTFGLTAQLKRKELSGGESSTKV